MARLRSRHAYPGVERLCRRDRDGSRTDRRRFHPGTRDVARRQGHSVAFTPDNLLANDRDDNGDPFRIISVTQPAHGTLIQTGPRYTLAPPASLMATAASRFAAMLAGGGALPGWMTLDPVTGAIAATPPVDILGSTTVQYTLTGGASPQTAQANFVIDGNQGAGFTYKPADEEGHSQAAMVTLVITSIDHAPAATPIAIAGQESVPVTVSLADILSHVVDAGGDPVQLVSITPNAGTQARALVLPDGGTQFVPDAYKYGDMAFSYVVTDG